VSILITGGSKGLGRAIAVRFAQRGDEVFINYHSDDASAAATAAAVEAAGGKAHLVKADVSTIEGAYATVDVVAATTGRLGQLVHCAVDTTVRGPVLEMDPFAFAKALQCNASALIPLVQRALPLFHRGSSVIFLTSRGSQAVVAGYGAVGVPKAMAEVLIQYLAVELAPLGVRANCVAASAMDTDALRAVLTEEEAQARLKRASELNPSGRNIELDEVVDTIEFLASDRAVMVQGQRLNVDGGFYLR
jgi:enoyl-[acyl-carrier protein] reductase III